MAEINEGRALLRNFRLRQHFKLLPGQNQPAGTVSLKRLEELRSHDSFGYESESAVEALPPECARKTTLQGQLLELNATKAAEMSHFQEVELAAQSLQQEMANMMDEHKALTRQRYEFWSRQKELTDETLRLQAVLTDLSESDAQVQKTDPPSDQSGAVAKTAERLKLHHLHLQRLLEEQKLLKQELSQLTDHVTGQR